MLRRVFGAKEAPRAEGLLKPSDLAVSPDGPRLALSSARSGQEFRRNIGLDSACAGATTPCINLVSDVARLHHSIRIRIHRLKSDLLAIDIGPIETRCGDGNRAIVIRNDRRDVLSAARCACDFATPVVRAGWVAGAAALVNLGN